MINPRMVGFPCDELVCNAMIRSNPTPDMFFLAGNITNLISELPVLRGTKLLKFSAYLTHQSAASGKKWLRGSRLGSGNGFAKWLAEY